MAAASKDTTNHSVPNVRCVWCPITAKELIMNTPVKPDSMLMALNLCVASLATPFKFIDIATKTSPVSAAEPVPTRTKKSFHCAGL